MRMRTHTYNVRTHVRMRTRTTHVHSHLYTQIYIYMEVIDYSKKFDVPTTECERHAEFFPKNNFCVIAGATGSGKTNFMVNLLLQESMINYADVHIYSKTLFQPAYEFLKSRYKMF